MPPGHSLMKFLCRGKPVVCELPTRLLAIREIQTSLGFWIPYQVKAIQKPTRVRRSLDMAALGIQRLRRLLLCSL